MNSIAILRHQAQVSAIPLFCLIIQAASTQWAWEPRKQLRVRRDILSIDYDRRIAGFLLRTVLLGGAKWTWS